MFKISVDKRPQQPHTDLERFNFMQTPKTTPKAEQTGRKILDPALELFRLQGFDASWPPWGR
jgi:hypothetical protein